MKYADVIVDITLEKLDRTFQYGIPAEMESDVTVGSEVLIPFGRGNRKVAGFVLSLSNEAKVPKESMKEILSVQKAKKESENTTGQLIALAGWISDHFGSTMNQALKTVFPTGNRGKIQEKKLVRLAVGEAEGRTALEDMKKAKRHSLARERLLSELLDQKEIPWDLITGKLHIGSYVIRDLEARGLAIVESVRAFRDPLWDLKREEKDLHLTEEQAACIETVRQDQARGIRKPYLLYGVTGSGKTEVYMELIQDCLDRGEEAIVLIPEIALTYQTVMRFYQRFGDLVSILNSRMSPGERMDQLDRARNGSCRIMVGPRSALFTPFSHLGLMIVDEEHESSYKSEQAPRYHARDVAIRRGELSHATVILGSATPSVETYEAAADGKIGFLQMKKRVEERPLPTCEIEDLREELRSGNRSILSRRLQDLMTDRLNKGEQIMLFLNRRGMMGFVSCRSCGKSIKCPHCDVSLTLHRDGKLHCHYCGYTRPMPKVCPTCGSPYIGGFRAGTEKVEEAVKKIFPKARVLRMDADTTRTRGSYRQILEQFSNREADILVGTQMIVKGHDFPYVTLVGILAADMSLNAADFRGAERTFQLITQAAGRAGRGQIPGQVVIQTYQPDHYSIQCAAAQDYPAFYQEEIQYRRLLDYPPAGHLLMILLTSEKKDHLETEAKELASYLREEGKTETLSQVRVLGPEDAGIARIRDVWRKTVYLKHSSYDKLVLAKNLATVYIQEKQRYSDVYIWFDFDPL